MTAPLPNVASRIADDRGSTTREWRAFFMALANQAGTSPQLADDLRALAGRVGALESLDGYLPASTLLRGLKSVRAIGTLASGAVLLELTGDTQTPGRTYYYGSGPDGLKGWHRLYGAHEAGVGLEITDSGYLILGTKETPDALPGTGNTGEAWRVVEPAGLYAWDGAAFTLDSAATGVVGYRLAPLADTGIGAALVKLTRDGYGRVEGTEAAVLDDLSDVDAAAPSTGDALVFDGANWAPGQVATEQLFQRMTPEADFRITADGNLRVTT